MERLKLEIARKRKLLEETLGTEKKCFKREELEKKREEEYLKKYGPKEDEKSLNLGKISPDGIEVADNSGPTLPRREVIRRFRERGEPITLFGETELDSFRRLRKLEVLEPEVNRGLRNDFQEALERVDQAYVDEILYSANMTGGSGGNGVSGGCSGGGSGVTSHDSEGRPTNDVKVTDDGVTYDQIQACAERLGEGDRDLDMNVTSQFLTFLLKMWGNQLNSRPASEKTSTKGKMASATYTQTQVYLDPLLRKLKSRTLPEDISDSLTEIIRHLLDRNYIMANDAYLQMAIGNAPWPIGVTMVGIHARTGREKIFSKNVAHVMNDETQRKYIQALKRLMTRCQQYFPTDPSRCVEYAAFGPS
ncbi:pre-mRNA-splicing factor 18 [Ischnura elegans]|uniref:pre-mRNA-splicing factor 18 n=1 Tax=Ischnura elegans TaxID=197161 RepID=UPI001ED87898|nr:pre-mRNA-splicing factor 18 [Ischnura elegans]XP_046397824.1 pre-mRNA-splicing factor 18 [Ischnura elegans]